MNKDLSILLSDNMLSKRCTLSPIINSPQHTQAYIDRAIELRPDYAHCHHLRGQFSWQCASLNWVERHAAALLFATPPHATYEDALRDFKKVCVCVCVPNKTTPYRQKSSAQRNQLRISFISPKHTSSWVKQSKLSHIYKLLNAHRQNHRLITHH
jgi:hypothetical protein